MSAAAPQTNLHAVLRLLLWLAASAFITGFAAYLVLGHPRDATVHPGFQPVQISSGPASNAWNLPKAI